MLECIVNVSEGRRGPALEAVVEAGGVDVLDVHVDADHHRSVLTLVGEAAPRAVAAAAVAAIDLRRHHGAHPRLGALDVVPFVALDEPAAVAVAAADRFAAWLGGELGVPAFRYGDVAVGRGPLPTLPEVRRGAFAGLRPVAGPLAPHPTAGATAVGARGPLVAYNVWLAEPDLARARAVAAAVRGPAVRALGLRVGGRVQVSMNLVDPAALGPAQAYDLVASRCEVAGAELVGLVPEAVLGAVDPDRWDRLDLGADRTIEARLARRAPSGGGGSPGRRGA